MTDHPNPLGSALPCVNSLFHHIDTHVREFTVIAQVSYGNEDEVIEDSLVQRVAAISPHLAVGVAVERYLSHITREGYSACTFTPMCAMLSETEFAKFDDELLLIVMGRYDFYPVADDEDENYVYSSSLVMFGYGPDVVADEDATEK